MNVSIAGQWMRFLHRRCILVAMCLFVYSLNTATAAPPFKFPFVLFKRVDADPRKSYRLSEEHGPWLIVAATFMGESGEKQAQQLVLELRKRYKLAAYTFKREFDYGQSVRGLGVDKYNRPKKMKYMHNPSFEETAVLVGDFVAVDDHRAQKVLDQIKHATPQSLIPTNEKPTSQRMIVWREIQRHFSKNAEMKRKGPMRSAFITRNPLLPEEYFAPKGPDKLIVELNRGLEYSLLDCPGAFSVRVATFRGESTWNVNEIEVGLRSAVDTSKSKLVDGAEKARKLVAALRKRGIEAYQFHDRYESLVTIGSFDSVGPRRRDGKIELNPEIRQIMRDYGATVENLPGLPGAMAPRTYQGIPFDPQPLPVKVPRISIASNLFGLP